MCLQIHQLRQSIAGYAKTFDSRALTPAQAEVVMRHASAIESIIVTVKAMAAARSAESEGWKAAGHRSALDGLSAELGTTAGQAKDLIETGRRLAKQPEVAGAALSG